jgi:hypothetical protein
MARAMSALGRKRTRAPQRTKSYSITSLASTRSVEGIVRPNALAVFRLINSSNLVGCWTGRSAGFAPAAWREFLPMRSEADFQGLARLFRGERSGVLA